MKDDSVLCLQIALVEGKFREEGMRKGRERERGKRNGK